ncbi:hypothetical protein NPIL_480701 [Nephila pilipes]|uniref:Uncharacterized protein n=1 Tax=Nephila pilipes TaxID=299642 RepID=A0A8X6MAJ1_NEPPI|nr:hypothetical protein NPIL_480701 [Nephila pilipes]
MRASIFLQSLRRHVHSSRPIPASRHSTRPAFITKDLFRSAVVLLRIDRVRKPLELPYAGHYKVVGEINTDSPFVVSSSDAVTRRWKMSPSCNSLPKFTVLVTAGGVLW